VALVLVPKTEDEQNWFYAHMIDSLASCTGASGDLKALQKLWSTNAASIKALPKDMQARLVELKEDLKKKLS
jgi:hypothetical protein